MPSASPFFCSEPPLRSGSDPAPISFTGIAPRRSAVRTISNPKICGPSAAVSGIVNLHKELHLGALLCQEALHSHVRVLVTEAHVYT